MKNPFKKAAAKKAVPKQAKKKPEPEVTVAPQAPEHAFEAPAEESPFDMVERVYVVRVKVQRRYADRVPKLIAQMLSAASSVPAGTSLKVEQADG